MENIFEFELFSTLVAGGDDDSDDDHSDGGDRIEKRLKLRKQKIWDYWKIDCQCHKCSFGLASNSEMLADPAFGFVSNHQQQSCSSQPLQTVKLKCVELLNKFKGQAWSKELEIIVKAYSHCILQEYNCQIPVQSQAQTQCEST